MGLTVTVAGKKVSLNIKQFQLKKNTN